MTTAINLANVDRFVSDLDPDLAFVFDDNGVHREVQAKIAECGFIEAKLFAKADGGEGEVGLWKFLDTEVSIKQTGTSVARIQAARVVLAWEASKKRITIKNESEAQQRVGDGPRTIARND